MTLASQKRGTLFSVPLDPTQAMTEAAFRASLGADEPMGPDFPALNATIWRAMVMASPATYEIERHDPVNELMEQVWKAYWDTPGGTDKALKMVVGVVLQHCAKISEGYDGDGMQGGMDCHLGDAYQTRREIADLIRKVMP